MEFEHNHSDLATTFKQKSAYPTNALNHSVSILDLQNRIWR